MNTLKVLSALLSYPEQSLIDDQDDMIAILDQENLLRRPLRDQLVGLMNDLCNRDLMDSQADYVELFDRGRTLSLLLFEHVHGESRDRGQAMVDLLNVYNQNGYDLTANELPDHIPLFLEYLSQRPDSEVIQWLTEIDHILALLGERLAQREHPYQVIFQSLLSLLETNVDMDQIRNSVAAEVPDNTPEALDKVWEEEAVRFGGDDPTGSCASAATTKRTQQVSVDSIKRTDVSH
jgi:nitrate reductase delta subunit